MSNSTTYLLPTPEADKPLSFDELTPAIKEAQKLSKRLSVELEVIHKATKAVAFVATPVPSDQHFQPWTRVETPKFQAPHIEGWRPAYTRSRIQAVVYRSLDERKWLVLHVPTGEKTECATTKEACGVTRELRLALKAKAEDEAAKA